MPDFIAASEISIPSNQWTNVTGGWSGLNIAIQNKCGHPINVWFGVAAPTSPNDGVVVNYSQIIHGLVGSSLWVYSPAATGLVHISETDN
jgi:hypothetical protein